MTQLYTIVFLNKKDKKGEFQMQISESRFKENLEWLVFLQKHTKKEEFKNPETREKSIRKAKEIVRQYYRDAENKDPYCRVVHSDCDYFYERIDCPKEIKTYDEAEVFFSRNYYRPYQWTYYDCTGQWFTSHYTIGKAGDRFVISHCVACDV